MSDIAEMLVAAAATGKKGVTIWPTADGRFQANVKHKDDSWTVEFADAPDSALAKALDTALRLPRAGEKAAGKESLLTSGRRVRRSEIEDLA